MEQAHHGHQNLACEAKLRVPRCSSLFTKQHIRSVDNNLRSAAKMIQKQAYLLLVASLVCEWMPSASGHGRLWDPTSRSSMWRRSYGTPINYDDNQLFCGGFSHQVNLGYKCGLCGDPYDRERENETGGKYATGKITQTYKHGQKATIHVDLTAAHKGYFEFKVCARNDSKVKETQECLDNNPLPLSDGSGYKFYPGLAKMYKIEVVLPKTLICDYCVMQWRYHTGNSWGVGPDGVGCVGCGNQEEFYGCADFRITPANDTETIPSSDSQQSTEPPTTTTLGPTIEMPENCRGKGRRRFLDTFCRNNCNKGYCPTNLCVCPGEEPLSPRVCRVPVHDPEDEDLCTNMCKQGFCPNSDCLCL